MTRILKDDRNGICRKAVDMATEEDSAALWKLGSALATALHQKWLKDNVNPADRKLLDTLSPAFVKSQESGQQKFYIYLMTKDEDGEEKRKWSGREKLPVDGIIKVPAVHSMGELDIDLNEGTKLAKQLSAYQTAVQTLNKKKQELYAEIRAVLEANITVKKLLAVWPEVRELIPNHYLNPPEKVHLPAFNPAKLNMTIGLPTGKKKKAA